MVAGTINNNTPDVPIKNQMIPDEGPKAIPLGPIDFSVNSTYEYDLSILTNQKKIAFIQGFYVDNSENENELVITSSVSQQVLKVPALFQGYFPFFASNPPRFTISTTVAAITVKLWAYNVPISPMCWQTEWPTLEIIDTTLAPAMNGDMVRVEVVDGSITVTPSGTQTVTGTVTANQFIEISNLNTLPKFYSRSVATGVYNTSATAAVQISNGNPRFFLSSVNIYMTPDTYIAAGGNFRATLLENSTEIVSGYFTSGTTATGLTGGPIPLVEMPNLNLLSLVDNSTLNIVVYGATNTTPQTLAAGIVYAVCGRGQTSRT